MKRLNLIICLTLTLALLVSYPMTSFAQRGGPPASPKAAITQTVGVDTVITIEYSRPGVKGRKIWGELVPYGLAPGNSYSDDKPFPWRAGANQNTTIEFSKDVLIEGEKLAAGKYGIHMIPEEKECIVIFSKTNDAWGSFQYNKDEDALRVTVAPKEAPHEEWMSFGFDELTPTSAVASLHWEKIRIPIKIELVE
ncbi:DUF2911 domain-containing protein [Acidobacteriota bacterium]